VVSNVTVEADAEGGVAGAIKGLFGKKDKETEDADAATNETETETKATKPKPERVPVKFRESAVGYKPLSAEDKRKTNQRLMSIATFEAARVAREEARNLLEGYLYRLQNLLSDDADNRAIHDYASDDERKRLNEMVQNAFDWLHDHADDAKTDILLGKRAELETLEMPIISRFKEYRTRGEAVQNFGSAMLAGRSFLVQALANRTQALEAAENAPPEKPVAPPKFTQAELDEVRDMIKEMEAWIEDLMQIQAPLESDKTADPVIFVKDMDDRGKKLQMHVQRLEKKKQPRAPRPPKPSTTTAAEDATETSEATSGTTAESEETPAAGHDEL
jgi:hypoxia up-regulated 1